MIQKFKQFVNEAVDNDQRPLSVHETINEPFTEFISRAQERLEFFTKRIGELLHDMDEAIEDTQNYLGDVIVGEPTITVDTHLWDITAHLKTNVPNNDEAWEDDDSPATKLEHRLYDLLDRRNEASVSIYHKPDEDGNCIIELEITVLRKEMFGEFTEALEKLGEEW